MAISIKISQPSQEIGFVEYKRSFVVQGNIESDMPLAKDCQLEILLYHKDKLVRKVLGKQKNQAIFTNYHALTTYQKDLDPGFKKLQAFGFPELVVDDINNYQATLKDGSIKAWFSDTNFKGLIISASSPAQGAIFDDGMNYYDENHKPYEMLPMGNYQLVVNMLLDNKIIASNQKEIIIGKRTKQMICRFNPQEHKERMIKWAKENDLAIITDLLPGYLESYLGVWYYHLGLLKMYRANDVCLFDDVKTIMFNYLIDESSTSYASELAYLQKNAKLNSEETFECFYYDIGEAKINDHEKNYEGKILKFTNDNLIINRLDLVEQNCQENKFILDDNHIIKTFINEPYIVKHQQCFALKGIVKPTQLDPDDFILQEDNTYKILNKPEYLIYKFKGKDKTLSYKRFFNMERFVNKKSIEKSVYEFYNLFTLDNDFKNQDVEVNITYYDSRNQLMPGSTTLKIKII